MTDPAQNGDRRTAVVFSLIVVAGLVFDMSHDWFWNHWPAQVSALLLLLLTAALLRRHRFAWWVFVIICAAGIPAWVPHGVRNGVDAGHLLGLAVGVVELTLLLSTAMRRYVGIGRRDQRLPAAT
jgi:hypothetical protein